MAGETARFLKVVGDAGVIAAGATVQLDLETIKQEFGFNFNTLILVNNSTEEIEVYLDRRAVQAVPSGSGTFAIDYEDGIIFSDVQLKNLDGANATSANEIRVSIGRTGAKNG